jgi:hypothetical protein
MEQTLISKKDLLELTGISYGQLYRWKRKNLIPEDWFIRKSTFTGQETFFPKENMLARIDKIKNMKDDLSLDELADVFSPNLKEMTVSKKEIVERNIVSSIALETFIRYQGDAETFPFDKTLFMFVLEKLLQTGEMSLDEGKQLLSTFAEHYRTFEGRHCDLWMIRKMGVAAFLLTSSQSELYFDPGVKIVTRLPLAGCIAELKLQIT